MKKIIMMALLLNSLVLAKAEAWSSNEHRIIAMIAYTHLDTNAKAAVNRLTSIMFHYQLPEKRFLRAAVWPDQIKYQDITAFNAWHYISYPYSRAGARTRHYTAANVAWAISQCNKVLGSNRATRYEKAVFLSFLIHFVGDASQPLHCISLYSRRFPYGDRGGSLYPIDTPIADNLHSYWDQALGLYASQGSKPWGVLNLSAIQRIAKQLTAMFPQTFFAEKLRNSNPYAWTRQGYYLAKQYAYAVKPNAVPSQHYIEQGRKIAQEQMTLAGYRLAKLLNHVLTNKQRGASR